MENQQEKHGPSGFLMGLIIGGAVGALISTKRGRQILKDLADYGLEYVGKTIDIDGLNGIFNEEEEEMLDGEIAPEESPETPHESTPRHEQQKRRLFHGIRRR